MAMAFLGIISLALGTLMVALGGLYALLEYRYGGAIFYWSLMIGLMLAGVGLALMGTRRRWAAGAGASCCLVSLAMTAYWHRSAPLDAAWLWGIGIGCSTGILYAAAGEIRRRSARRPAGPTKE